MRNSKPILLVEDDHIDAMRIKRGLKELDIPNSVIHRTNGEEALEYLTSGEGEEPCVIFSDLNMPKMNGVELLEILKTSERFKQIPVVVLTTSQEESDIAEAFSFSIAGYIVKSIDNDEFLESIKTIYEYWTLSELPGKG